MYYLSKLLLLLLLTLAGASHAVSLGGLATDDTVCDLGPEDTKFMISSKIAPVYAGTPRLAEVLSRLALRFATASCSNGQLLILRSEDGTRFDERYIQEVAVRLCTAADVVRQSNPSREYERGFQYRCKINKKEEASAWLAAAEAIESTDTMVARGKQAR